MSGPAWGRSQGPLMKRMSSAEEEQMQRQAQESENASPIVKDVKKSTHLSMREYYARRREMVMVVRDGDEKEQMMLEEAVHLADSLDLDPVMVHTPVDRNDRSQAVIRFMDTGKKRHDFTKKQKEAKKTQAVNEVKEVRIGYNIGQHDLDTRLRASRDFLTRGHRVKLFINLKPKQEHEVAIVKVDEMIVLLADWGAPDGKVTVSGQVIKGVVVPHKKMRIDAAAAGAVKPPQRLSRKEIKANAAEEALKVEKREARAAARQKESAGVEGSGGEGAGGEGAAQEDRS